MKLNNLIKIVAKKSKRLGRGHASGKGKTSARGTKGQKSREKIKAGFEGGQLRLIKRLPFRRGVGNPTHKTKSKVFNLEDFADWESEGVIDKESLLKKNLISEREKNIPIKVLGSGNLSKALIVRLPTSQSAKEKIEAAGGKVELND